jgi:hypothetical protein
MRARFITFEIFYFIESKPNKGKHSLGMLVENYVNVKPQEDIKSNCKASLKIQELI